MKNKRVIYKIIFRILLFLVIIIFVIPSILILIYSFGIPKQPISKISLPNGNNGIYLGMNIDDLKKEGKNFEFIREELTDGIKKFPPKADYTIFFTNKEKIVLAFRSRYPMNSAIELRPIVNNFESLYGEPRIAGDSGGEYYQWSDKKTNISIYHQTWDNFGKGFSTEEKKLWEEKGFGKWYTIEYSRQSSKPRLSWLDNIRCFWSIFFGFFEC